MTFGMPSSQNCFWWSAFCLSWFVVASGCGDADRGYVTGKVTLRGEPVGPGTILFEPIDPSGEARAAIGYFGADGQYALKSAGNRLGARIGEYRIVIQPGGEEAFSDEHTDPQQRSSIPPLYADHGRSPLTATVKPGKNTLDFTLGP